MDLTWCHNPPFRFPNTTLTSLYRLSPQHLQRWKAHNQLPFFDPRHLFSLLLCVSSCSSLYWALLVPGDYLSRALHLYVFFGTILMASCMYVDLLFFGLDLLQTKASSWINIFSQTHHDLTHPILPYVQNFSFHDIASGADHVRIQRHTSQSTLSV